MYIRNRLTAGLAAVTVAFALGACGDSSPSSPSTPDPEAVNRSRQVGLVNVSTGNIDLLNNVNLAVAANVIATVCGVNIPVAVLATQVLVPGGATACEGSAAPITIEQAVPYQAPDDANSGNRARQEGLINVSLGDVAVLNNVNAAIAANVLVTACGLTVPVAILAVQAIGTAPVGCETTAGLIDITQSQG